MRIFTFIITIIVLLVGVSFAILNAKVVSIDYYMGVVEMPLSLLLTLAFVVGVLVGLTVGISLFFKAKVTQRHLRKQLKAAQKKIEHWHRLPLENK